jgi:hypothetical protein
LHPCVATSIAIKARQWTHATCFKYSAEYVFGWHLGLRQSFNENWANTHLTLPVSRLKPVETGF